MFKKKKNLSVLRGVTMNIVTYIVASCYVVDYFVFGNTTYLSMCMENMQCFHYSNIFKVSASCVAEKTCIHSYSMLQFYNFLAWFTTY